MAIKIRQTPYQRSGGPNVGPYQVHPDRVRADVTVIAMAGSNDLPETLGEDPDSTNPDLTAVSYDPGPQDTSTAPGRVRDGLKTLVDRPGEIILFGVGPDFVWSDGSTIDGSAGAAIGNWIFYDTHNCDGDGRWVRGTDGNEVCTTSAGILFHELGHVFLNHPAGTRDQDERGAVGIENDLREAQGLVKRDPDNWPESDCGCPNGCCIVASTASGSPFSSEVHALRKVRDYTLRNTTFGRRLFDALHREYYSFSIAVCRVMVADAMAKRQVERWLVKPLVRVLLIALEYFRQPDNVHRLGECVRQDHEQGFIAEPDVPSVWQMAQQVLQITSSGQSLTSSLVQLDAGTVRIHQILARSLPGCPHVRWGIINVLSIYAAARAQYAQENDENAVGEWLREAFDEWLGNVPLDDVLDGISSRELISDLRYLASTVFTTPRVRRKLGERIGVSYNGNPEMAAELQREGYL
jgi:hypothetical protein